MKDVTVIIPFCERGEMLDQAVRSVERALAAAPSVEAQILPVDDTGRHGVSWARNRGLDQAEGEWIVFVDADDELSEDFFTEVFLRFFGDETCDLVTCGYHAERSGRELESEAGQPRTEHETADVIGLTGYGFIEKRLLNRDTHVWAKMFRRLAVPRFHEDLTIGEDMLFLADCALGIGKKRRVIATSTVGYRYRINPAGAMEKPYDPSFLDEIRCWKLLEEQLAPERRAFSPYAFAALGGIRVRSAMLVAVRIARLPAGKRETPANREALQEAQRITGEMLRRNGVFAGLSMRDKARALLLRYFPGQFVRMAAKREVHGN